MTTIARAITGGVDTHLDVHVAAALDERGAQLGVESFADHGLGLSGTAGWLEGFGTLELVGVEGTGSYGAGLTRHLSATRSPSSRWTGPTASAAGARASPTRTTRWPQPGPPRAVTPPGRPRPGTETSRPCGYSVSPGPRPGAARTQAINQMRSLVSTAPEELRAELRDLSIYKVLTVASALRHTGQTDVTTVTKLTLRTLARRALSLEEEVKEIDRLLKTLVAETAPELNAIDGVGTDVASAILVAAGDNPERLKSESTFAKLCGVSPLDASSGKQERHRLNRSGDRQANSALWHIVFTRMVNDPRTKHYIERRMKEGRTKKEAIRCLKRYVAREVFAALPRSQFALDSP